VLRKRIKDGVKALYYLLRTIALFPIVPLLPWWRPRLEPVGKILVIRLDRLGDLVLTLPLIAAVKRQWPSAELTLLCREATAPLAQAQPEIDRVITLPDSATHVGRRLLGWPLPDALVRRLQEERYDMVIDPFSGEELETAWLAWKCGARVRLGFSSAGRGFLFTHRVAPDRRHSMLKQQQCLLAAIDIEMAMEQPRLILTEAERQTAAQRLRQSGLDPTRPIIGIHPGGFYPTQRWPLGRFLELARQLEEADRQIAFFGTRAEERLIAQIGTEAGERVGVFFGLELREFIALMSWCRLIVCNNSGPLHLATALGLPTVSTMGPTDPVRWWPFGEGHIVVRKPLWCSPCREGQCPLGTHDCLMTISVEEMLTAVNEQMARQAKSSPCITESPRAPAATGETEEMCAVTPRPRPTEEKW
jgi:lipopolysaccharide heptosyltransferase II